jgi:hypothetical protein
MALPSQVIVLSVLTDIQELQAHCAASEIDEKKYLSDDEPVTTKEPAGNEVVETKQSAIIAIGRSLKA